MRWRSSFQSGAISQGQVDLACSRMRGWRSSFRPIAIRQVDMACSKMRDWRSSLQPIAINQVGACSKMRGWMTSATRRRLLDSRLAEAEVWAAAISFQVMVELQGFQVMVE